METHVSLLQAVGSDQRVDLGGLDVIYLADGLLNLSLVGGDVDNEHQSVVLLNLLHGGLGGQGVLDHVELLGALHRLLHGAGELGGTGELQGLGLEEVNLGVNSCGLAALAFL